MHGHDGGQQEHESRGGGCDRGVRSLGLKSEVVGGTVTGHFPRVHDVAGLGEIRRALIERECRVMTVGPTSRPGGGCRGRPRSF